MFKQAQSKFYPQNPGHCQIDLFHGDFTSLDRLAEVLSIGVRGGRFQVDSRVKRHFTGLQRGLRRMVQEAVSYTHLLDSIRQYKTVTVPLPDILENQASCTFTVYATPNDTGKKEIVYDKMIYTSLFPLKLKIPVSFNGETNVSVYIDNKLYYEYVSS